MLNAVEVFGMQWCVLQWCVLQWCVWNGVVCVAVVCGMEWCVKKRVGVVCVVSSASRPIVVVEMCCHGVVIFTFCPPTCTKFYDLDL